MGCTDRCRDLSGDRKYRSRWEIREFGVCGSVKRGEMVMLALLNRDVCHE